MKKLSFWKMSGSGNDFVVVDHRRKHLNGALNKLAATVCDRHFGVGADGLLLLEPSEKADFRMVYFNADGSRASMCGNGARCIAWAAHEWGIVKEGFDFETDAGIVEGLVKGDVVQVTLGDATGYRPEFSLAVGKQKYQVSFINTGVPHAVMEVPAVDKVDVLALGRAIRFHKAFGAKGANVNFIQCTGERALKVRTYERGVEGETLACGTGVTASAITAALRKRVLPRVQCETAGGDVLEVGFNLHPTEPQHPTTHVTLTGKVRRTFIGEVEI